MDLVKTKASLRTLMLFIAAIYAQGVSADATRIMVVGDSLSAGWERPSFRMPLVNMLKASSCDVDMVGNQSLTTYRFDNPEGYPGKHFPSFGPSFGLAENAHWTPALGDDTDHQAFPGIQADELASGTGIVSPIADYISTELPDYILLQTGSSDLDVAIKSGMRSAAAIDQWADETVAEIGLILERAFNAHQDPSNLNVLVGNYLMSYNAHTVSGGQQAANTAAAVFSEKLSSFVADKQDSRIQVVDVASGFDVARMSVGGSTPNSAGEAHIAKKFFTALQSTGFCNTGLGTLSALQAGSDSIGNRGVNLTRDVPASQTNSLMSRSASAPALVSPQSGSVLAGRSATFRWTANSTRVQQWWLRVGSSPGAANYYSSGRINDGAQLSETARNLPTNGSTVYVSLFYKAPSGSWKEIRTTYRAASSGGSSTGDDSTDGNTSSGSADDPNITQPSAGSTLSGSSQRFTWNANSTDVRQWWFMVGSSPGEANYYNSGRISNAGQRSINATGLPANGQTLHVSLHYKLRSGSWKVSRSTYRATTGSEGTNTGDSGTDNSGENGGSDTGGNNNGGAAAASLVSPSAGARLSGRSQRFTWNTTSRDIRQWWFRAGSGVGKSDFYDSGRLSNSSQRSVTASGLPTNGRTVYVSLFFRTSSGSWQEVRSTYRASTSGGSDSGGSDSGGSDSGGSDSGGSDSGNNDSGGSSSGGSNPPALDLSKVRWLHTDVSGWAESATMTSLEVNRSNVCMNYNRANSWPSRRIFGADLVGNAWVFIWNERERVWYGATWEWLRPGQTCKKASAVDGTHIKRGPYSASSGWEPRSGETLYFMVSGLARTGDRNVRARTKPVKVIWP